MKQKEIVQKDSKEREDTISVNGSVHDKQESDKNTPKISFKMFKDIIKFLQLIAPELMNSNYKGKFFNEFKEVYYNYFM